MRDRDGCEVAVRRRVGSVALLRGSLILTGMLTALPQAPVVAAPGRPANGGEGVSLQERVADLERRLGQRDTDETRRRGALTFARACAACHGTGGHGDGPAARDLLPRPRDLTAGQFRFRTTPTGDLPSRSDIRRTIRQGLPGGGMPAFAGFLSDGQMEDLAVFIESIQTDGRRFVPEGEGVAIPAPLPAEASPVEVGRAVYLILECWSCHGVKGDGRGPSAADLVDDGSRPIRPTDFRYAPMKGGRTPEAVIRTLVTGLNGTPMPAYGDVMLFAREDVSDLSGLAGRVGQREIGAISETIAAFPTREEIEALDEAGRSALRDRRLTTLARYVLSLDRHGSFLGWLFRVEPEKEARR